MKIDCSKTLETLEIKQNRKISGEVDKFGIELVITTYTKKR